MTMNTADIRRLFEAWQIDVKNLLQRMAGQRGAG